MSGILWRTFVTFYLSFSTLAFCLSDEHSWAEMVVLFAILFAPPIAMAYGLLFEE